MVFNIKNVLKYVGLVAIFAVSGIASAHAPVVSIDPIVSLDYATFPKIYNVTGVVSHHTQGNVTGVSEMRLFIDGVQEGVTFNPTFSNDPSAAFSLPWNITGPGTYTVKVTARHGNSTGNASEEVLVTETVLPPVVITECPAAPAIAGAYMKSLSIKSGSTTWKNVIKNIASRTGSKGDLWAANACEDGYEATVKSAVDTLLGGPFVPPSL